MPPCEPRAKEATPRSISVASRIPTGLNSMPNDGAIACMTAHRRLIEDMREEWRSIDRRIKGFNDELAERVRNEDTAKRLIRIPGIGVLTATALVAAVGNAQTFSCGRDLAARQRLPADAADPWGAHGSPGSRQERYATRPVG